jgi:hypothetical protein
MNFNCASKISQLHSEILINISPFCKIKTFTWHIIILIGALMLVIIVRQKVFLSTDSTFNTTSVTAAISIKNKLIFGPVPVHVSIWNMGHLYMFRMFRKPVSVLDEKSNKTIMFHNHLEEMCPRFYLGTWTNMWRGFSNVYKS